MSCRLTSRWQRLEIETILRGEDQFAELQVQNRRIAVLGRLDEGNDQKVMTVVPVLTTNDHPFTVGNHFDHWIDVIEELKAKAADATILIGHDGSVRFSALSATQANLREAKTAYGASTDAPSYVGALKSAFPDRQQIGWLQFSSRLLYSRIKP
jgi:urease beta subunit